MDERVTYTDCELRYIDQGYDLARAAEVCAEAEGRSSDAETGKSRQDETWDDYWGET
jgi:hypothetical protein